MVPPEVIAISSTSHDNALGELIASLPTGRDRPAMMAVREAIVTTSYTDLAADSRRLASALRDEAGLNDGERVAFWGRAGPAWVTAFLATLSAGAVAVPLDVQMEDDVVADVLKDAGPHVIFCDASKRDRLKEAAGQLDPEPRLVLLDDEAPNDAKTPTWRDLSSDADEHDPADLSANDTVVLFYTSGTTGPPKGVPLTAANLGFQLESVKRAEFVRPDDRVLLPLPLHHVYPLVIGTLVPLAIGACIVFPRSLTGPQVKRALGEAQATGLIAVPRLLEALWSGLEAQAKSAGTVASAAVHAGTAVGGAVRATTGLRAGRTLLRPLHQSFGPDLRLVASGGSALDPDLAHKLRGLGWDVATGYGLTETSPLLTWNIPADHDYATAGRPLDGVELRIDTEANPAEDEARRDERVGEVLARGPGVFGGYHNLPDKTRESLTDDGFFRTGDLGYVDERGFLHLVGRASTMIVTAGGENVQPDEVEEAYATHEAIREIGVLQREDDERLVALVVPETRNVREAGDDPDALRDAIGAALNEQSRDMPSCQRADDFRLTRKPLPRTRLGKLRRHELKEQFEAAESDERTDEARPISPEEMSGEDRELLEDPAARAVWEWLTERFASEPLTPDTNLRLDLGVDSMEWVNLTLELGERTGVELEDEAVGRIETVHDLLQEVTEASTGEGNGHADVSEVLADPEAHLDEDDKRWLEPLGAVLGGASHVSAWADALLVRGLIRLDVHGREHLPDEGPLIIAANHLSYIDPFVLAAALGPDRLDDIYWGGWTGVAFANPLVRAFSRLGRVLPVDPAQGPLSALAMASAVLQRGQHLAWFPEGERSENGELQPFKPGIGLVLSELPEATAEQVRVVPTRIDGTHAILPPGRALPHPGRVRVSFGEPIAVDELCDGGEGERPADRITAALQNRVAALA